MSGKRWKLLLFAAAAGVMAPLLFGTAGAVASNPARPAAVARPASEGRLEPAARVRLESGESTGWVALCNDASNYNSFIEFPYRVYYDSPVIPPGQCWVVYMGSFGWEPIYVMGEVDSSGAAFWMGTVWYDGYIEGMGITTYGQYAAPGFYTW